MIFFQDTSKGNFKFLKKLHMCFLPIIYPVMQVK